jgi:hypothetical protein
MFFIEHFFDRFRMVNVDACLLGTAQDDKTQVENMLLRYK